MVRSANGGKLPKKQEPSEDGEIIFRRSITLRNGKILHAHQVGLTAFPIKIKKRRKS